MSKVLVIGCGGVAGVAISKCCQVRHRSMQTTCSSFVTLFKATSRISS